MLHHWSSRGVVVGFTHAVPCPTFLSNICLQNSLFCAYSNSYPMNLKDLYKDREDLGRLVHLTWTSFPTHYKSTAEYENRAPHQITFLDPQMNHQWLVWMLFLVPFLEELTQLPKEGEGEKKATNLSTKGKDLKMLLFIRDLSQKLVSKFSPGTISKHMYY